MNGDYLIIAVSMLQFTAAVIYAFNDRWWDAVLWTGIVIANIGILGGMR